MEADQGSGVRTCASCKHWEPPSKEYQKGYGDCEGIPYHEKTTSAYHIDCEGYSSSFFTKAEFFCALWEKKGG